jgi:hypothetical protein
MNLKETKHPEKMADEGVCVQVKMYQCDWELACADGGVCVCVCFYMRFVLLGRVHVYVYVYVRSLFVAGGFLGCMEGKKD